MAARVRPPWSSRPCDLVGAVPKHVGAWTVPVVRGGTGVTLASTAIA